MSRPSRRTFRAVLSTSAAALSAMALSIAVQAAPALAADTATINGASTHQTVAGFGFSEAFGQASGVMNSSSSTQQQVFSDLFSTTSGAGLDIIRNWIGGDPGNSIEPNNPGSPNATPNSQWPGGFTAQVVIGNTSSSAISSWSLVFTFPGDQKVTSNFNGGFSQSGATATLTNASYNGSIPPGGSVTDGFQGTWTTSDAVPTSFTLNGTTCTT